MPFVNYTANPDNSVTFFDENSQPLTAPPGPAAAAKMQEIDDLRTAMAPDGGAPEGGPPRPAPSMSDVPASVPGAASSDPGMSVAGSSIVSEAPPSMSSGLAPASAPAPGGPNFTPAPPRAPMVSQGPQASPAPPPAVAGTNGVPNFLNVSPNAQMPGAPAPSVPPNGPNGVPNFLGVQQRGWQEIGGKGVVDPGVPDPTGKDKKNIDKDQVVMNNGPTDEQAITLASGGGGGGGSSTKVSTSSTISGKLVPEEDKLRRLYAHQDAQVAAMQQADAEAAQNDATIDVKKKLAEDLRTSQALEYVKEIRHRSNIEDQIAEVKQLHQDLLNTKIDPDHYFRNKSTGSIVLGALAAAISGAAGAKQGRNEFLEMVDKEIDRDIDSQKAALNTKKDVLQGKMNLVDKYMGILGDERAAASAARGTLIQGASKEIDAIVASTNSPIIKARGAALKAELDEKYAKEMVELNTRMNSITTNTTVSEGGGGGGGGGGAGSGLAGDEIDRKNLVVGPDGEFYELQSGAEGQKAREEFAKISEGKQRMRELLNATMGDTTSPEGRQRLRTIGTTALPLIWNLASGIKDRFSDQDIKLAKDALGGDPDAILAWTRTAAAKQILRMLDENMSSTLAAHKAAHVKRFFVKDSKSNAQKYVYRYTGKSWGAAPKTEKPEN